MAKLSQHDEREIKDYVKYNPTSLGSHKKAKSKALSHKKDTLTALTKGYGKSKKEAKELYEEHKADEYRHS